MDKKDGYESENDYENADVIDLEIREEIDNPKARQRSSTQVRAHANWGKLKDLGLRQGMDTSKQNGSAKFANLVHDVRKSRNEHLGEGASIMKLQAMMDESNTAADILESGKTSRKKTKAASKEISQISHKLNRIKRLLVPMEVKKTVFRRVDGTLHLARRHMKKSCTDALWLSLFSAFQKLRLWSGNALEVVNDSKLWRQHISNIQGRHGSQTATYFQFLRWTLMVNVAAVIIWVGMVWIPFAVIHRGSWSDFDTTYLSGSNAISVPHVNTAYTTLDLVQGFFTGTGPMFYSAIFISHYTESYSNGATTLDSPLTLPNGTNFESFKHGSLDYTYVPGIRDSEVHFRTYTTGWWYLVAGYFHHLITFIFIVAGLLHSYKQVIMTATSGGKPSKMSVVAFGTYDHGLCHKDAVALARVKYMIGLKQNLQEAVAAEQEIEKNWILIYVKRIFVNLISFAVIGGSLYAVLLAVEGYSTEQDFWKSLIPTFVLLGLDSVIPAFFGILAGFEDYSSVGTREAVTVTRSLVTRLANWYNFFTTQIASTRSHSACWEGEVGTAIYSVFIIASLIEIMNSASVDAIKYGLTKVPCLHSLHAKFDMLGKPEFYFLKHITELLYTNLIVLFGSFFCPLLPLLAVIRVTILFYVKKWATRSFCLENERNSFFNKSSLKTSMFALLFLISMVASLSWMIVIVSFAPSGYQNKDLATEFDLLTYNASADWGFRDCNTTTPTATCADCDLRTEANGDDVVCYKSVSDVALEVTRKQMCALCPSGCGPFRNQESILETLLSGVDHPVLKAIQSNDFTITLVAVLGLTIALQHTKIAAFTTRVDDLAKELHVANGELEKQLVSVGQRDSTSRSLSVDAPSMDELLSSVTRDSVAMLSLRGSVVSVTQV